LNGVKLLSSNYMMANEECSGSFFTSIQFLSTEHCHDFYEFCLITEGEIMHIINGHEQLLTAGSLLFIRPKDTHYFRKFENIDFQYINLAVRASTIQATFDFLGEGFDNQRFLMPDDPMCMTLSKIDIREVQQKLEDFILISYHDKFMLNTELRTTLIIMFTQYFPVKVWGESAAAPDWLEWLNKEMHKRANFINGVTKMQELSGKSPEHLCRQFKKHYNQTPTEFINSLRLDYAKNLLILTDETVIDISYLSGFPNLSHFYHEFKKKYGVSPVSYRSLNQRKIVS
jgi:AraC family transcriptional regulator, dual regulator of chb operon